MKNSNLPLLVTALHGNEPVPLYALASLGLPVIVGNPRALISRQRFTERDLNASFNSSGSSYEEERARDILQTIPRDAEVVDFHTFSCDSPPFSIVTDLKMLALAARLGVRRVVHMKHNIKGGLSLCDHRNVVSVEVGKHDEAGSFTTTEMVARRLLNQEPPEQIELFEAYGIIERYDASYENFELHKDGFIPVLAGEKAYDHGGLKAKFVGLKNF